MVPVEALTRYSMSEGEKGPPWDPENAMLVEGATINDGGDCPAGLCAAPRFSAHDAEQAFVSSTEPCQSLPRRRPLWKISVGR